MSHFRASGEEEFFQIKKYLKTVQIINGKLVIFDSWVSYKKTSSFILW
jgi:hypothetical protein